MTGGLARLRGQSWIKLLSTASAGVAASFFLALVGLFLVQSLPVWAHEGVMGYLGGTRWHFRADEFGVAPMIYGTLAVSTVAVLVAGPVGLGAALYSAEIASSRIRMALKSTIELLAGVPSVVYGLLGILLLRRWVYRLLQPWDPVAGDTLLTGGLLLAVMILPTVMTLCDDALMGVERTQREAARSVGLTRAETLFSVSLPQALPGLVAAVLLGLGRALGETIAVFLVVGRQDGQWPESLLSLRPLAEPGQTLTSKLGGSETYLAYGDPLHWAAIVGLGLVLLVLVLGVTLGGGLLRSRMEARAPGD